MRLTLAFVLLVVGCGGSNDGGGCDEKAEIDTLAVSTKTYGSLGSTVDVSATAKDQCPNVDYKGVYAIKEGAEPSNCTDGDSKVAGTTAIWNGLKPATAYYVRACLSNGSGYTSPGITKAVTTPAVDE